MAKHNEAIDRFRRRAYAIGGAEFQLGMKSVDLTTLQNLAQFDPDVPEHLRYKPESRRKIKARLRARKHALKVLREQGAQEYHVAGDGEILAQVIMY
jgi:hypothetical protein